MLDSFEQIRPAPQFERETPQVRVESPAPPDLDAMAQELAEMKVDALVDAERTRPTLNSFFALIVIAGASYIVEFVAQDGTNALNALTHTQPLTDPTKLIVAGAAGIAAAGIAGLLSLLAARRTQQAVVTFERRFIALGGEAPAE